MLVVYGTQATRAVGIDLSLKDLNTTRTRFEEFRDPDNCEKSPSR